MNENEISHNITGHYSHGINSSGYRQITHMTPNDDNPASSDRLVITCAQSHLETRCCRDYLKINFWMLLLCLFCAHENKFPNFVVKLVIHTLKMFMPIFTRYIHVGWCDNNMSSLLLLFILLALMCDWHNEVLICFRELWRNCIANQFCCMRRSLF